MTTRLTSVCGRSAACHFQLICFRVPLGPPRLPLRGEVGFRGEALLPSSRLPLPRPRTVAPHSSCSPGGHRLPPLLPRLSAQPRTGLSQGPSVDVTSGQSASGPPKLRYWSRSLEPAGATGPCSGGARLAGGQRRSMRWPVGTMPVLHVMCQPPVPEPWGR